MIILGIDPGYAIIGYGILDYNLGNYKSIASGAILTDSKLKLSERLEIIFNKITDIINKYNPDVASIERLYFNSNQKTVIKVAEARGVLLLAIKKCNIPVYEYTPLQVKSSITGYGRAPKEQVIMMTKMLLNLYEAPKLDDTADALALAICHANCCGNSFEKMHF